MKPGFNIGLGLFVAFILTSWGFGAIGRLDPLGGPDPDTCVDDTALAPVTINVPANGTATFGIADLLDASRATTACLEMAAIDASSFVAHAAEGSVSVIPGTLAPAAGWSGAPPAEFAQRFMFTARSGFSGVSEGWEFVMHGRNESGADVEIGVVKTTFQVRNVVPVAANETVMIAPGLGTFCAGVEDGLLANDVDANGDPIMVYSNGITPFPWGFVDIHADGSYRVTVTDPRVTGSEQVRYLVWDRQGSTTGADLGILTVTFDEDAMVIREPMLGLVPDGGCNAA